MSTRLATRMSLLTAAFVAGLALSFTPITPVHADEDPVVRQPRVRVAPPRVRAPVHTYRHVRPVVRVRTVERVRYVPVYYTSGCGGWHRGGGACASAGRLSHGLHDLRRLCGRCADLLCTALLRTDLLQRLRWLRPAGRSPLLLGGADGPVLAGARLLSLKESQRPVAVRRIAIPDPPSNPSTQ
jgi:hypothetical protein